MRIVILKGSPNIEGSSNMLAKNFSKGAIEAGHEVKEVDVANANISPCIGCVHCGYEGECVLNDDMNEIRSDILKSERNFSIQRKNFKSALLTVAYNADDWTFDALEAHYDTLIRYLNLDDCGRVLGYGCGTPAMTKRSRYPDEAYNLGKSL